MKSVLSETHFTLVHRKLQQENVESVEDVALLSMEDVKDLNLSVGARSALCRAINGLRQVKGIALI